MPVLHMDLKLGLSTDKTRTLLGEYSRGCPVEEFTYSPKLEFIPNEEYYYPLTSTRTLIFISDFFGSEPSFDLTLIKEDQSIVYFPKCNILIVDCSDISSIKVVNISKEIRRAHIIR